MSLQIDAARLSAEIDKLATFSESPAPSVTRLVFSKEDKEARRFLAERFEAAGLSIRVDAIGNTFARWQGSDSERKPVGTGSHIDAIPNAGKYDGVVGVLGPLEAVRALQGSGFKPVASIDIILFTSEEPTRFGLGCLGSRMLAGNVTPDAADSLRTPDGYSLDDLRNAAGIPGDLGSVRMEPGAYDAFVELHIEQGPILERESIDIGVVERIAAPAAWRVRFVGEGGHAGAVLMPRRRDASLGGAEAALALEKHVLELGSPDGVATTGVFQIRPGAINSVPFEANLEVDIRDTDHRARQAVEGAFQASVAAIAQRRKLELTLTRINSDPPAICDPRLVQMAETAANESGCTVRRLVSRAYHDSLFMSLIAPVTMIFIPCHQGFSHRPDEFSSSDQIAKGVNTLARLLEKLAS